MLMNSVCFDRFMLFPFFLKLVVDKVGVLYATVMKHGERGRWL